MKTENVNKIKFLRKTIFQKTFIISLFLFMSIGIVSAFDFPHTIVNIDYSGNLTNLSELLDTNIPTPTDNYVLSWDSTTSMWIAVAAETAGDTNETTRFNVLVGTNCGTGEYVYGVDATGLVECRADQTTAGGEGKDGDGIYLYNDSTTMYFNETRLNNTIDLRATGLGDNSSWNQSLANTLYYGLSNPYNFYNSTNPQPGINSSWNETHANTLYRLQSWDNITGIPHATPSDGDTTHFSLADEIYDWVIGLAYATETYVDNLVATYTHLSNFTDDLGYENYTHLTNFTDDLGDRGYTSNLNFTNDANYINSTNNTYYNATQSEMIIGTLDGGTLSLTQHPDAKYDGVSLNFSEASGSPGLDLRVNFTNVNSFNRGVMRYKTSDLIGDFPIRQLWNYDSSKWDDYPLMAISESFAVVTQPIFDSSSYVEDGVIQLRLYKASNGNTNNHYYIDWVAMVEGFGLPSGEEIDPIWGSEKNNYYNSTDIDSFSYWNSTFALFNKTYADTLYAEIGSGNSSWNESYADTLYYDLENSYGYYNSTDFSIGDYFNDITNFTGTLTDGKICIYDSSQQIINCTYTDQTGVGGNVKAGDGTYLYNDTNTIYFNSTHAGINLAVNSSDYWDSLGSPSDIGTGDITDEGTWRLQSWNNLTGIPHATPSDGDTTHFSLADEIYDWVIGLAYISDVFTHLTNFTDDLGDRGYTSVSNFTNDLGFYNSTDFSIADYYLLSNPYSFYNSTNPQPGANSSWNESYADTLYADISITGDNSSWNESYADTLYYPLSNPFGFYNSTDFSIADYYPLSNPYSFYNSTNPQPGANSSWNETYADGLYYDLGNSFSYYNSTDFDYNDYYLNSNPYGYWNSTFALFNKTYADSLYAPIAVPASTIVSGTLGTGNYIMDSNLTVEKIVFENDASHFMEDNSTCIIIRGDTSILEIC